LQVEATEQVGALARFIRASPSASSAIRPDFSAASKVSRSGASTPA
jgi:hypothetical protein